MIRTVDEQRGRKSLRLAGHDYGSVGHYFVTIVTADRVGWFGEVDGGVLKLNVLGDAVLDELVRTPSIRPSLSLDAFVVMPNHVHAIFRVVEQSPGRSFDVAGRSVVSRTIGAAIRGFKAASTRRVNIIRDTPGAELWQRNYYDRVIRDAGELDAIRAYIRNNPRNWSSDPENPDITPDAWEKSFWLER